MTQEKISLTKEIEELVQKSLEVNKLFLTEGSKFIQQLGSKKNGEKNIRTINADTVTNTVTAYMRLNIQHLKNMLDLGVSLTKEILTQQSSAATDTGEPNAKEKDNEPSFTLRANGIPGTTVNLQFLIENSKTGKAVCELFNTEYTEVDTSKKQNFKTVFTPQSFTLDPGSSQTITIKINIPKQTNPGVYTSNAQVKGFEPAFFSIHLTITER